MPLTNGGSRSNSSPSAGGVAKQQSPGQAAADNFVMTNYQKSSNKQTTEVKMTVAGGEEADVKAYAAYLRTKESEEQEEEEEIDMEEHAKYLRTQETVVSQG